MRRFTLPETAQADAIKARGATFGARRKYLSMFLGFACTLAHFLILPSMALGVIALTRRHSLPTRGRVRCA
jgi:hypothetical protein